jgi:hydroxysqualene dehydroxylase
MTERRVVVVGGGLAGIAAALECVDAGCSVTLLEARPRLGGATFSVERDGLTLDNGQHVFLRCCTAYRGLLDRLGSAGLVDLQPRLDIPILRPGLPPARLRRSRLPAPVHLAPALARFAPLGVRDRLGVVAAALRLRRVDPDAADVDLRTFGDWLDERRQSAAAVEALWDLFCVPTLNVPAREASLALAAKVFRTGLLEHASAGDIGYARVPLDRLHAEPAAFALRRGGAEVRLRARVARVAAGSVTAGGERLECDAAIVAVPHREAAEILPPGALPAGIDALGESPIVNVHVIYDRPVLAVPFAAGLGTPAQFLFDRTGSSGLPAGQCLAVSMSAADAYAGQTADEIAGAVTRAVRELLPAAASARVVATHVVREPRATFRQGPGTAAFRPRPRTPLPGIYVAGAWTDTGWPATMEGAVRSGLAAAGAALADLGRSPARPRELVAT